MRVLQTVLTGFLLLFVYSNSTQAAPVPSWSVNIQAGEYQPISTAYAAEYGPGAFQGNLELGYYITPRLQMGLSLGYFYGSGTVVSISGRLSALTQQLILVPTQIYIIYQFAFEENQVLVPYFGGGFTRVTYQHSVEGEDTAIGGMDGYHARAGVKLLLNRFDPNNANNLYADWRIIHTYFLLEGQYSRVNDFDNSSINLGGWSYFGGFQFEF